MLLLLEPSMGAAFVANERRKLKRAGDRLAARRSLHALLETLRLLGHRADATRAKEALFEILGESEQLLKRGSARTPPQMAGAIARFRRFVAALSAHTLPHHSRREIHLALLRAHRKAKRRMKIAFRTDQQEAYHRWRSALKVLSFQLGWASPAGVNKFTRFGRHLFELEQRLGLLHDVQILERYLRLKSNEFREADSLDFVIRYIAEEAARIQSKVQKWGIRLSKRCDKHFWKQLAAAMR